jgi:hypothetical protein
MSDTFPVSLSGPACSGDAMPATMTGGGATVPAGATTVATTMPTTVSVSTAVAAAVSTTIPAAVSTTIPAAVSTTIPATVSTTIPATATAFGVGDIVSNDEAALAEFHGLGRPRAYDRDGQGRPRQPLHERAPLSGPVTRRFGFDLHGCFSWGVADSF